MKKTFLSVAILATMVLTACSSSEKATSDKGAELKAKIENCSNPDSLKVYIQQVQEYAETLIKEGNDSAASAFVQEITPSIIAKDPSAVSILPQIKSGVQAVATEAVDSANAVVDAAKETATQAVTDAKAAAAQAVDNTKAAAKETVDNAKAAANEAATKAVDNTKAAASNAIQSAADKAKSKIK